MERYHRRSGSIPCHFNPTSNLLPCFGLICSIGFPPHFCFFPSSFPSFIPLSHSSSHLTSRTQRENGTRVGKRRWAMVSTPKNFFFLERKERKGPCEEIKQILSPFANVHPLSQQTFKLDPNASRLDHERILVLSTTVVAMYSKIVALEQSRHGSLTEERIRGPIFRFHVPQGVPCSCRSPVWYNVATSQKNYSKKEDYEMSRRIVHDLHKTWWSPIIQPLFFFFSLFFWGGGWARSAWWTNGPKLIALNQKLTKDDEE